MMYYLKDLEAKTLPELKEVAGYIQILDRSGYFDVTNISDDDIKRNEMYRDNAKLFQVVLYKYKKKLKTL